MKKELQELFEGLNTLCETNEAFYFSEQDYNDTHIIRSYTYRLASWTDFQLPYALDCRGTAFIYDKRTETWDIFTRAYRKFFNLGEGIPKEDYIKDNDSLHCYEKIDGSLILVGLIGDKLVAKSKTSINSDHAKKANELIKRNQKLQDFLKQRILMSKTPVMELVGPGEFRIVIGYDKNELIWLGEVDHIRYEVHTVDQNPELFKLISGVRAANIDNFSWDELTNIQENGNPDTEGFVVRTQSGFVKCKKASYVQLHHTKDQINNLKNLVQLILDDNLDDLMGLLQDDKDAIDYITKVQTIVAHKSNHLINVFKDLRAKYFKEFSENRKEFALKYSKEPLFGYVMKSLNTSFRDVNQVAEAQVRAYINKTTNTLTLAQEFVGEI